MHKYFFYLRDELTTFGVSEPRNRKQNECNNGSITNIYNNGLIQGLNNGIYNSGSGIITTLVNDVNGTIGGGGAGLLNDSGGTIGTVTNIGVISSAFTNKVSNSGTITTLNNLNGGVTLTYTGDLPNQGKLRIPMSTAWETEYRDIVTGKQIGRAHV